MAAALPTAAAERIERDSVAELPPQKKAERKQKREQSRLAAFWKRLGRGNIDRTFERKLDVSFIGAPSYSKESSLGVGMLVSGLYRIDRTDSVTPPSDISLFGNVSIKGQYQVGISGNTLFDHNRSRLTYEAAFSSRPLYFWGVGYDSGLNNRATEYVRKQVKIDATYLYEVARHTYVGGVLSFSHNKGKKFELPAETGLDVYIPAGQKLSYTATGIGALVQYDSRDFIPNPSRGAYLMLKEIVYPKWVGSCDGTLFKTFFSANGYQRLWESGTLAAELYGEFSSEDTPWPLLSELGGGYRMRGYYRGRYTDRNMVTVQVELRQRIWRRIGCTLWGGAGNVFSDRFAWDQTLPNWGVGLRWEFKKRINVRFDFGFGKETMAVVFNVNEAF